MSVFTQPIGKTIRPLLLIGGVITISYLLIKDTGFGKAKLIESEYLFGVNGLLLGFALTLLTFIVTMLDKIKEGIKNNKLDETKKNNMFDKIERLHKELRDDIYFIFFTLLCVALFLIFEKIDFPYSEFIKSIGTSKLEILNVIKSSIFLLNMYVIYDLLRVTFAVSDTTGITNSNLRTNQNE